MPNAIKIMAKAAQDAGLSIDGTVQELFKLMEEGKVASNVILPHFAKRMREAAQNNGGLEKALESNRVAMNRFIFTIQDAANLIFKSGFAEGLTDLFNTSAESMKPMEDLFKAIGKIAGSVFKAIARTIETITPIFESLGYTLKFVTDLLGDFSSTALLAFSPAVWIGLTNISKGFAAMRLAVLGVMAPFAKWALILVGIIGSLEELTNLFTREKQGILFDPTKAGPNATEHEKNMAQGFGLSATGTLGSEGVLGNIARFLDRPISSFFEAQSSKSGGGETPVIIQVDGETLGQVVVGTNSFNSGVEGAMHPFFNGTGGRY